MSLFFDPEVLLEIDGKEKKNDTKMERIGET